MLTSLPPGPSLTPEEQTFAWFARPFTFLNECREKYGDSFTLEFKGLGKHIFFSEPDAVQQILNGDPDHYYAGEGNAIIRPFLGKNSLLTLDGKNHDRHRKLMTPAFHGPHMKCYFHLMYVAIHKATDSWKVGSKFSIHDAMMDISLEIILLAVFGSKEDPRIIKMKELLVPLLDFAGFSTLVSTPDESPHGEMNAWDQFTSRSKELDVLLFSEISDRLTDPLSLDKGEDILSILLSASLKSESPLSQDEIRDEIITLLLAGHETTATALSWAFYWIHSTPDVLKKVREELDASDPHVESDPLHQLHYLEAVVKETLRINPVIPVISRQLQQTTKILNYTIPSGLQVTPCIYLVHHRPELYPDPDQFKPERFLNHRFGPHEYLPFGGGVRRCIGMAFGMAEMKMVLALILKKYELELIKKTPIKPIRRTVTIFPAGGVKMKVQAIRN